LSMYLKHLEMFKELRTQSIAKGAFMSLKGFAYSSHYSFHLSLLSFS
jgi:hypothetical protein